ncbi:hypothetical protein FB45DRAFT_1130633 [Roridomyces roridus]|uniref:F-box domain-containing protein n=1 Tax=Roridomyces roridus TaxID=1738132 RepID=A0AAD7F822_9AGAR|nr:hypothetical protein FB45DRAFT_1130633 [Roridomyces roridus]
MSSIREVRQRLQSLFDAIQRQSDVLVELRNQHGAAQSELNSLRDPNEPVELQRQQDVLVELESQHRVTQSELNSLLDPMARLPVELSSDILRSISPSPTWKELSTITCVSRMWRSIALGTIFMWDTIRDDGIQPANFPQVFGLWLERGQSCSLSLALYRLATETTPGIFAAFRDHAYRVEKLDLHVGSRLPAALVDYPFVGLKSLTIDAQEDCCISLAYILDILRNSPRLVECNVPHGAFQFTTERRVSHPALRTLRLGRFNHGNVFDAVLRYLKLPCLETLGVALADCVYLRKFLSRSRPPLRSLQLYVERDETLGECLDLIPGLTHLEICIWDYGWGGPIPFLALLAEVPECLPALQHLIVHQRSCEGILDFLLARRGSLRSLRLELVLHRQEDLPGDLTDVATTVHEFINEGMDIRIERAGVNLL